MTFSQGDNSFDVSEMFDDKSVRVRIRVSHSGMIYTGYVDFKQTDLRELRKWITIQIGKMKALPKPNTAIVKPKLK